MRPMLTEDPEMPPRNVAVAIRDDGPTRVDFMMHALAEPHVDDEVATADINDFDDPLVSPPGRAQDREVALDTAKTLSDGDIVVPSISHGETVRDTPAAPANGEESPPPPTLELPMRDDFYEESEGSMSVKARVIPVRDSTIAGRSKPTFLVVLLIALVLMMVSVVIVVSVVKSKKSETPVIIDESAQSSATTGR
jgi:hypothetical protein